MARTYHSTMPRGLQLAAGQTWRTGNGETRQILKLEAYTPDGVATVQVRREDGVVTTIARTGFRTWLTRQKASLEVTS